MIKYITELYTTEKTSKKTDDYIFDLYDDKFINHVYAITLSQYEKDVFDIVSAKMIRNYENNGIDIYVLGIAENRSSCESLCEKMIMEYMDSADYQMGVSMREYFENKLFI